MRVLHIITGLDIGGAQAMLAKLVEAGRSAGVVPTVVSMMTPGEIAERIRSAGATVHSLGMRPGRLSIAAVPRLLRIARAARPDLIQGWMYHGNLAASLASASLKPQPPVVWGIRHSLNRLDHEKPLTRVLIRAGAGLSGMIDAIAYNSRLAAGQHAEVGYAPHRAVIIPNGFDCSAFRPDPSARERLCAAFAIHPEATLVGMITRPHPGKSPETLIEAVRLARQAGYDLHLLVVGSLMSHSATELATLRAKLPPDRLTIIDLSSDVAALLPGLDILALPSWGEAFPNILGEAMASGVPCIATDVGDSRWVVGDCGRVVPPGEPCAMAEGLIWLASIGRDGRQALGQAGRLRISEHFSLAASSEQYTVLYDRLIKERAERRSAQLRRNAPDRVIANAAFSARDARTRAPATAGSAQSSPASNGREEAR